MYSDPILDTLPRFAALSISVTESTTLHAGTIFSVPTNNDDFFYLTSLFKMTCHPVSSQATGLNTILLTSSSSWHWSQDQPLCCFIQSNDFQTTLNALNQFINVSLYLSYQDQKISLQVKPHPIEPDNDPPNYLLLSLLNQPTRFCFIDIYPIDPLIITDTCTLNFGPTMQVSTLRHLAINSTATENRISRPCEPIHIHRAQLEYTLSIHHPFESSSFAPLNLDQSIILSPQEALWSHGKTCSLRLPCEQCMPTSSCDFTQIQIHEAQYTSVQCILLLNKLTPSSPPPNSTPTINRHNHSITHWNYLDYRHNKDWLIAWKALLTLHRRINIGIIDHWIDQMVDVEIVPLGTHRIKIVIKYEQSTDFDTLSRHVCRAYFNTYRPLNLQVIFDYALL